MPSGQGAEAGVCAGTRNCQYLAMRNDASPHAPGTGALRAARDLGHLDLLVLIDSARRFGHLRPERLAAILASFGPVRWMMPTALPVKSDALITRTYGWRSGWR